MASAPVAIRPMARKPIAARPSAAWRSAPCRIGAGPGIACAIAVRREGDNVRITTKNDVQHKFVVTKITNKALYGQNARVVYEDMAKVEILKKEKAEKKEGEGFFSKLNPFD